jgi:hypothetical protein
MQALDMRAELAGGRLSANRLEQRILLILGTVAQLVQAEVVVAPLQDGELRCAA